MSRAKIKERLSSYWKMEGANVFLVPGLIAFLASSADWSLGWTTVLALVPVCLLLAIGAQYWRAKLIQLSSGAPFPPTIGLIAKLKVPSLVAVLVATVTTMASFLVDGIAASEAERWVASAMTLLAVLEYVNYYHRQLQHFDHLPDLKRLFSGRGFRQSQMAIDIARWRAATA